MDASARYDEKALLAAMREGSPDAFGSVYEHYHGPVKEFVVRFVKSPELAEDLSQEIFIKVWDAREKLWELNSFRAFLFVIARNHTLNTLKSASRKQEIAGEIARHAELLRNQTEDKVLSEEYQTFLQKTLDRLPPKAREVFRLCREQHKTYEEVAALLGISRNTVKNHMIHSLKILKESVEKDLGIPLSIFLAIVLQR